MGLHAEYFQHHIMGSYENGVRKFLERLNLGHYWEMFQVKGYDRDTDLLDLAADDMEVMGIEGEDKMTILHAATSFHVSPEFTLRCWLEEHGLGYYYENFRLNDFLDLKDIERLDLNEELLDTLEMSVPGHKKRLQKAVSQLRKRRRVEEPEDPVARGFWGKPALLNDAKNDFLCLKADLVSSKSDNQVTLDFMVDSGSDVVTVRQEVLSQLDLELIGTIQSHGVHATKQKQLYKGILRIGDVDVEAEVMAESYDSIGNQVMRNFRHYIDTYRHFWLKSDVQILPPSAYEQHQRPQEAAMCSPQTSATATPAGSTVCTPSEPSETTETSLSSQSPSHAYPQQFMETSVSETTSVRTQAMETVVSAECAASQADTPENTAEQTENSATNRHREHVQIQLAMETVTEDPKSDTR